VVINGLPLPRDLLAVIEVGVALARAGKERLRARLEATRLLAPYDGIVAGRLLHLGQFVGPTGKEADGMLTVVRMDAMRLVVQVPKAEVPLIQKDASAVVTFPVLSDRELKGKVARVGFALKDADWKMTAEIDLANARLELRPGMQAAVRISVAKE
jgi:HlyD family secretion protein